MFALFKLHPKRRFLMPSGGRLLSGVRTEQPILHWAQGSSRCFSEARAKCFVFGYTQKSPVKAMIVRQVLYASGLFCVAKEATRPQCKTRLVFLSHILPNIT